MKECTCIGHQGDVVFFSVDAFPKGEFIKDDQTEKGILAYGELTGHAHEIENLDSVEVFKIINKAYSNALIGLNVKKEISIRHGKMTGWQGSEPDQDYHKSVTLKPGKYITGIVEEYDPFLKISRRVTD